MAPLTNVIAAEEDELEVIGESLDPITEWSGLEEGALAAVVEELLVTEEFECPRFAAGRVI